MWFEPSKGIISGEESQFLGSPILGAFLLFLMNGIFLNLKLILRFFFNKPIFNYFVMLAN